MKTFQNIMIAVLSVVFLGLLAAVWVPMSHTHTLATSKTVLGFDTGKSSVTYVVRFKCTIVQEYDCRQLVNNLLTGKPASEAAILAAYKAAGLTDVSVSKH